MEFILIIAFIIIYLLFLFYWQKKVSWRLAPKTSRIIKKIHHSGLLICSIIGLLFFQFNIGLRGLWTTRIIIIIVLIIGIFFILVAEKTTMNKLEKLYFRLFSLLPVITAGTFFVPFLGVVLVLSLYGQLIEPATDIYYEDSKLRIQSTFIGILGPPIVDFYGKKWIFEKRLKRMNLGTTEIDSIKVNYDTDSIRVTGFYFYAADAKRKTETVSLEKLK